MITTAPNVEQTTEATGEKFCITDEASANWLLKKLAAIDAERALIKAQAAQRVKELTSDYDSLMHLYGEQLRAWAREEANRRRRQGVTIMYGTLAFRAKTAQLVIESEADALTTAKALCPDAIQVETVEKFDRDTFLAYAVARFEATGELLPGVTRTPEGESFSVSVKPKAEG